MVIFTILWVPTALVNNFAGLLVLRFLLGFFGMYFSRISTSRIALTFVGSPCLTTGSASYQDIVSEVNNLLKTS
jgi:DHA1 family multidrug resistance protein-like MFS transporter